MLFHVLHLSNQYYFVWNVFILSNPFDLVRIYSFFKSYTVTRSEFMTLWVGLDNFSLVQKNYQLRMPIISGGNLFRLR